MSNYQLVTKIEKKLDSKDYKVLVKGMLDYHKSQGHERKSEQLSIFLKDQNGKVFGGIVVTFLWNGMKINSLWVDEMLRKQGWGKKLLEQAEKEGIKRGCTFAYTDTFTWQAPKFYEKLGYQLYGELPDFPKGNSLRYYMKSLVK